MAKLKPQLPLLLGLSLRLIYGLWMGEGLFSGDAIYYVEEAQQLLQTGHTSLYWPPALIYLLAVWGWVFGLSWGSCMALMLLWHVAFDQLLQRLTSATWPRYLFAVFPVFIHHSVAPLTHLPVAVCLLALYLLYQKQATWQKGLLSGFLLGLGVLFRAGTAAVLGGLLLRRTLGFLVGLGLSLLLVIGTWLGIAYAQGERFIPINTANAYNFYLGNNPWTPDYKSWWLGSHNESQNPAYQAFYTERDSILALSAPEQEAAFREGAVSYISKDPSRFGYRVWQRFKVFWAFDTFTAGTLLECNKSRNLAWGIQFWECLCYGLLWTAVFGATWENIFLPPTPSKGGQNLRFAKPYPPSEGGTIYLAPLLYMLPYLLAFSHPTYHMPLLPLLAVMAPIWEGGVRLSRTLKNITWQKTIWGICVLIWGYIQIEWALALLV